MIGYELEIVISLCRWYGGLAVIVLQYFLFSMFWSEVGQIDTVTKNSVSLSRLRCLNQITA